MTTMKLWVAVALVVSAVLTIAACGGDSSSSDSAFSSDENVDVSGEKIKVLLPYQIPQKLLDEFTEETGVEIEYNTAGFDSVQQKLVVAHQAGTYIADVTDFDWSATGQYAGNGWYEPLQDALDPALVEDLGNTNGSFTVDGNLYAACYLNDFRISLYNEALFEEAGIDGFPETFDDLRVTLDELEAKGVAQAPMTIPMGATEGGVTPWFMLTLAMGGELFDEEFNPTFNDPESAGYKALEFEVEALQNGWVSPGSVTQDDGAAFESFTGGAAAIDLASDPGRLVTANDPKESSIPGDAAAGLVPGIDGPGASFGLPEGVGIPVTAEHKDAARAFIEWLVRPETQLKLYKIGFLPCGESAFDQLAKSGELEGGDVVAEQLAQVKPLFEQGAPTWYSQFSSEAQGLLNSAFKGDISVQEALDQLAERATELAQSAG